MCVCVCVFRGKKRGDGGKLKTSRLLNLNEICPLQEFADLIFPFQLQGEGNVNYLVVLLCEILETTNPVSKSRENNNDEKVNY